MRQHKRAIRANTVEFRTCEQRDRPHRLESILRTRLAELIGFNPRHYNPFLDEFLVPRRGFGSSDRVRLTVSD